MVKEQKTGLFEAAFLTNFYFLKLRKQPQSVSHFGSRALVGYFLTHNRMIYKLAFFVKLKPGKIRRDRYVPSRDG